VRKKVLVVSGSRGEYGYIRPFLKETIRNSNLGLDVDVCVTNMHLLPEHGMSVSEFEQDGIPVRYKSLNTLSGNSRYSMIKSLFIFGQTLIDILISEQYHAILLAGDRGEQIISAMAGFHLEIPVLHIQAGERSGHLDGMTRHAIARFSHIHICSNDDASARLIRFGEEEFRVKTFGAPQLDEIFDHKPMHDDDFYSLIGSIPMRYCLFVFHPTCEEELLAAETAELVLSELESLGFFVICVAPNSDSGSDRIKDILRARSARHVRVFQNLTRQVYLELLRRCLFVIGNSSSGILEAPVFGTPAINIGKRQIDRLRSGNVIDVPMPLDSIELASAIQLACSMDRICESPYGKGDSTMRIIRFLQNLNPTKELLNKRITS